MIPGNPTGPYPGRPSGPGSPFNPEEIQVQLGMYLFICFLKTLTVQRLYIVQNKPQ